MGIDWKVRVSWICITVVILFLTANLSGAQPGVSKAPKRSFSNKGKSIATRPQETLKEPTQQQLGDAILADTLELLWDQTDRHFHNGEYNHTINLNRIIVQGDPHNMEAYSNSAYLLWSMGRNNEVEQILNQGITANTKSYYMYDEMGRYWYLERKDPKAAIPYYEQAVKFDCPWFTWNALANCYEQTRQWDKAVAAWEKATLYPDDRIALRRLRQAREKRAQQSSQ